MAKPTTPMTTFRERLKENVDQGWSRDLPELALRMMGGMTDADRVIRYAKGSTKREAAHLLATIAADIMHTANKLVAEARAYDDEQRHMRRHRGASL